MSASDRVQARFCALRWVERAGTRNRTGRPSRSLVVTSPHGSAWGSTGSSVSPRSSVQRCMLLPAAHGRGRPCPAPASSGRVAPARSRGGCRRLRQRCCRPAPNNPCPCADRLACTARSHRRGEPRRAGRQGGAGRRAASATQGGRPARRRVQRSRIFPATVAAHATPGEVEGAAAACPSVPPCASRAGTAAQRRRGRRIER